jgi:hypothetical protein
LFLLISSEFLQPLESLPLPLREQLKFLSLAAAALAEEESEAAAEAVV